LLPGSEKEHIADGIQRQPRGRRDRRGNCGCANCRGKNIVGIGANHDRRLACRIDFPDPVATKIGYIDVALSSGKIDATFENTMVLANLAFSDCSDPAIVLVVYAGAWPNIKADAARPNSAVPRSSSHFFLTPKQCAFHCSQARIRT
jgi:hypothetical protein